MNLRKAKKLTAALKRRDREDTKRMKARRAARKRRRERETRTLKGSEQWEQPMDQTFMEPWWQREAWQRHKHIINTYGKMRAGDDEDRRFLTLALCGEVGELANIIKKTWRGDFTVSDAVYEIREELADIQIYLVILARALGIHLDQACVDKTMELRARWDAKLKKGRK